MTFQQFKIDSDIVLPERVRRTSWPFGEMKVGDSFVGTDLQYLKVVSAASYYGRRHGQKYAVYRNDEGFRCWRTA